MIAGEFVGMIAVKDIREIVCEANKKLVTSGLVFETWGNVSGVDRARGVMYIKPSGVPYECLTPGHIVGVSLATGEVVEGSLRPSSDTPTHLKLYRLWPEIGGVVHTHSVYATAWAQARRAIPCLGTTHADDFKGVIPCTDQLTETQVNIDYEEHVGQLIVETFRRMGLRPLECPGVLVAGHGPFTWGRNADEAVHNAIVLEYVARLATLTQIIAAGEPQLLEEYVARKHFLRKHGPQAYYGQRV